MSRYSTENILIVFVGIYSLNRTTWYQNRMQFEAIIHITLIKLYHII